MLYPDKQIIALSAKINAALVHSRLEIGLVDTIIAATAITLDRTLVSSNVRHFARVQSAGFSLSLQNWRE